MWFGALGVMLIAGLLLGMAVRSKISKPLGPALALDTATAFTPAASQPTQAQPVLVETMPGEEVQSVRELPDTPTALAPLPVCGGPPQMLILATGADTSDYMYGLADVIRIVRVDFLNPGVTVVSLPRDLWVEIPGIEDRYGYTHGKLNQAYLFGAPGMGYYDGPAGGPGLLARTIQLNYGLTVDRYVAGNMETFVRLVDALGGIDVELPYDVDGGDLEGGEGLGYYPAGVHHLNGAEALAFARIRAKYGDLQRQENQSLVLSAVAKKLLSPSTLPMVPELIASFQKSVLMDLSPEEIAQLTCLLRYLNEDNLTMTQLPAEIYTLDMIYSPIFKEGTSILDADPLVIRDYLDRFARGEWPEP